MDPVELRRSAEATARYREVELRPIAGVVDGYGAVGHAKCAGWRRGQQVEEITEPYLDAQMAHVAAALDPVIGVSPVADAPDPAEKG